MYTSLQTGQEAELSAGPLAPWQILRGESGRLTPFAQGMKQAAAPRAEGWVHVMDRKNCSALAIADFGENSFDRAKVSGGGQVTLWREYGAAKSVKRKRLRLWLHFVFFPPQFSAGASPQQMQNPLQVRSSPR